MSICGDVIPQRQLREPHKLAHESTIEKMLPVKAGVLLWYSLILWEPKIFKSE